MGKKLIFFYEAEGRNNDETPSSLPEKLLSKSYHCRSDGNKMKVKNGVSIVQITQRKSLKLITINKNVMYHPSNKEKIEGIGFRIFSDRLRIGKTLVEISEKINVRPETISKYERGKISENNMSIPILQKIAEALGSDKNHYLNNYHKWLLSDFPADIKWLLESKIERSVDDLAALCNTTHRSLYLWRDGVGKPNYTTYELVRKRKEGG